MPLQSTISSIAFGQDNHRPVSRYDLLPLLTLAVAVLLFFGPVILGRAWIPAGGGDLVSFIFPMYRFAGESLSRGEIPLWNPYLYAGAPFIADNQSGVFYPINLLLFLLLPDFSFLAIEGLVILHIFMAGLTMYFCLRWLQPEDPLRRPSAVLGGLAFMFSGVFVNHIGNLNLIAVVAWLPLIFICLHRAIRSQQPRARIGWALAGGAVFGLSTLAGHGQMTFLIAAFLGFYALYQTVAARQWSAIPLFLLIGIVGLATAAISLAPALESINQTVRAEYDLSRTGSYSLTWRALIGLAAPDFFGRGIYRFWGPWSRVEYGYLGILPWLLAGLAVVIRPSRRTLFFLISIMLFLLLALGANTPIYPLLLRVTPVFPFQAPARFVLLAGFCVAVLAATGLDTLCGPPLPRRPMNYFLGGATAVLVAILIIMTWEMTRLNDAAPERQEQMSRAILVFAGLAAVSMLFILARLRGWLSPGLFAMMAILLLAIDLIGLGRHVEIDWHDPTLGFATDSVAMAYVRSDPGIHRVDIASGWQPSLPQMARLFSIGGVYNPLELANYSVYAGSVGYRGSHLYNLMGVKYVIAAKDRPPGDTNFLVPVFADDPDVDVYLNTLALPRVMLLNSAEVVASHDAAFEATHRSDFDPSTTVILEEGQVLSQEPGKSVVMISRYDLNQASFEVTTDRPAYLLLTDIYHPDWQATVDGRSEPIQIADYAFRAVYLEPGQHTVQFRYSPVGWWIGLSISLLAWLIILVAAIWFWK